MGAITYEGPPPFGLIGVQTGSFRLDGPKKTVDDRLRIRTGLCGHATSLWTAPDPDFGY